MLRSLQQSQQPRRHVPVHRSPPSAFRVCMTCTCMAAAGTQLGLLIGLSQPHRQELGGRHLLDVCDWSLFSPQTNNELEAQRVATEFALRKRIRDLERAYDELKWQEQNVSVASLVIKHNLGWELNPKGYFLCGKLLGLRMIST